MEMVRNKFNKEKGLCLLSVGCLFVFFLANVPKLITSSSSIKCNLEKCQTACDKSQKVSDNCSNVTDSSSDDFRESFSLSLNWNVYQHFIISTLKQTLEIRGPPYLNS